jgi:hypothetical protein
MIDHCYPVTPYLGVTATGLIRSEPAWLQNQELNRKAVVRSEQTDHTIPICCIR